MCSVFMLVNPKVKAYCHKILVYFSTVLLLPIHRVSRQLDCLAHNVLVLGVSTRPPLHTWTSGHLWCPKITKGFQSPTLQTIRHGSPTLKYLWYTMSLSATRIIHTKPPGLESFTKVCKSSTYNARGLKSAASTVSDRDPSIDGFPTTWGHLRFKKYLIWLKMSMSFQMFSCDLYLGVLESHATSQVTRVTFSAHCFDTTDGKTSGGIFESLMTDEW